MQNEPNTPRAPQSAEVRARAAERRRQKEILRQKAMRRYHIFMAVLAVLSFFAVFGVYFIVTSISGALRGSQESSGSGESVSEIVSESAQDSESEAEPAQPAADPAKPADPELWSLLLTNTTHPLPEGYEPELESVGANSRNGQQFMEKRAAAKLLEMFEAAKADGVELVARSAYRSTKEQTKLFDSMKANYIQQGMSEEEAFAETKKWRNEPGTSEHETGLAVDIVGAQDINANLVGELEERDWAVWLKTHAADYGFILRYPADKTEFTGTSFEPWHYRYVGAEDAKKIMALGLSLEEYLGMTQ